MDEESIRDGAGRSRLSIMTPEHPVPGETAPTMRFLPTILTFTTLALVAPRMAMTAETAPRGEVLLPSGRVLSVEVADTPAKRERGYMFREKIGDSEGMLFLMERVDFHPFWMKNCKVALDILWLDEGFKVVHIERALPPCLKDPCPSYLPMQAGLYVLEMQSGLSAKLGIKIGDRIVYHPPS